MDTYIKKAQCQQFLFMFFYGVLTVGKALNMDAGNQTLSLMTLFASTLLVLKMLMDDWTKREFLIILIFAVLSALVFWFSHRTGILLLCLTLIGVKDVDIGAVIRFTLGLRLTVFVGRMAAYWAKITTPETRIDVRFGKLVEKHDFGFGTHPNQVSVLIFTICALYLYWRGARRNMLDYCAVIAACLFVYSGTKSRTLIFCVVFLIAIFMAFKFRPLNKLLRLSAPWFSPIITVGTCLVAFTFIAESPLMHFVDSILQSRLSLASDALKAHGVSFVGQRMSSSETVVDLAYVHSLIQYGFIFYFSFAYAQFKSIKRLLSDNSADAAALMLAFAAYGVGEEFIFNPVMNVSLLFVGQGMYARLKETRETSGQ
jgi:hypothetical protein